MATDKRETNREFRKLYESSGLTKQAVASELGVSLDTVMSWLKPATSKSSCECPSWRVDMFKMALDPEGVREGIVTMLKTLHDAGVMSDAAKAAFQKMNRAHKRGAK